MEILAKAGSRDGDEEHKNDSVSHHFSCPWKEAVLAVVVIIISVLQLYWFQFREFGIGSTNNPLTDVSLFTSLLCLTMSWFF